MQQTLLERFKYWVCDTFGHWDDEHYWRHSGNRHSHCKLCRRIISVPEAKHANKM